MCRTTKSREIPIPGYSLPQFGHPRLGASWYNEFELPCIFPFYYGDKLYTSCALLDIGDYNTPVYRCPIFNTTKKKNGINHFEEDYREDSDVGGVRKYCLDQKLAEKTCGTNLEEELQKLPNSPCKLTIDHTTSGAEPGLFLHIVERGVSNPCVKKNKKKFGPSKLLPRTNFLAELDHSQKIIVLKIICYQV